MTGMFAAPIHWWNLADAPIDEGKLTINTKY
jgi:hypothetical protein